MLGRGGSGLTPTWIPSLSSICFFLPSALQESSGNTQSEARCGVVAGEGPEPGRCQGHGSVRPTREPALLGDPAFPLSLTLQEPGGLGPMLCNSGRGGGCRRVSVSSEPLQCFTSVLLGRLLGLLFIIYYCSLSADRVGAFVCFVWVSI